MNCELGPVQLDVAIAQTLRSKAVDKRCSAVMLAADGPSTAESLGSSSLYGQSRVDANAVYDGHARHDLFHQLHTSATSTGPTTWRQAGPPD